MQATCVACGHDSNPPPCKKEDHPLGGLLFWQREKDSNPQRLRRCATRLKSCEGSNPIRSQINENSLSFRTSCFPLAAGEGFEPSHTESESAVLPLHNPAKRISYYTQYSPIVKQKFSKIRKNHASPRSFFSSACRAFARWLMAFFSSALIWAVVQPRSGRTNSGS